MKKSLLLLALSTCLLAACGDKAAPAAEAPATQSSTAAPAASSVSTNITQSATPTANSVDALLADPKVGDIYAALLSNFSEHSFNEGGKETTTAYGLMKVVDVQADAIIVITEDAAWDEPQGARDDLHKRLDTITWDESERITIKRSDLAGLKTKGDILDARRL